MNQRTTAAIVKPQQEPVHLLHTDPQHSGCRPRSAPATQNFRNNLNLLKLAITDRHPSHSNTN